MQLISPDELKEHGFTVPPTFNIGNPYITVRAEDMPGNNNGLCRRFFINDEIIDAIPTMEAEPVKYAYVIIDEDGNMECSNCGSGNCFDNYCGHCGAKLMGERKENEEWA